MLLTAQEAHLKQQRQQITFVEWLQACVNRIHQRESQVQAWEYLAIEQAQKQAETWDRDLQKASKRDLEKAFEAHPLLGIPIAIKDIFATLDMPTQWGTDIYQNRYLDHEAAVVSRLKQAGAIILGKTVTTELASSTPGATANPHHLQHTPGGSSSGSAAAVADGMVPLAIGSQTMGSILRPAAYCGIFGFKPSFGLISRYGMMPVCRPLDHVGIFSRSLADISRLLAVLVGKDSRDPDCQGYPHLAGFNFEDSRQRSGPLPEDNQSPLPRLVLVKTPHWQQADAIVKSRLNHAAVVLTQAGISIDIVPLPPECDDYWEIVQTLCAYGLYANHGLRLEQHHQHCSPALKEWFHWGQQISVSSYEQTCQRRRHYSSALASIFNHYDAVLTPVTLGPAPLGLANTGSPIFCGLWSLCGLPAINIPLGKTEHGLPLGCQLVGPLYSDQRLLKIAHQCWHFLKREFGDIKVPNSQDGSDC